MTTEEINAIVAEAIKTAMQNNPKKETIKMKKSSRKTFKLVLKQTDEQIRLSSDLVTLCMQGDAIEDDTLTKACMLITDAGLLESETYERAKEGLLEVLSWATTVPEFGISRTTGKNIKLRKRSGEVKFNQWKATNALIVQAQDILRGFLTIREDIGYDKAFAKVFPGGKMVSRSSLRKLEKEHSPEKDHEPIAKTIERFLNSTLSVVTNRATKKDIKEVERLLKLYTGKINGIIKDIK